MDIKHFSTKELVNELKIREGVEFTIVEPHENKIVESEGPAIVIKVID